jgi:hypothetical protein
MADERVSKLVCKACEHDVECCAVCEREDCKNCVCYRCLRIALRHSRPQLEDRVS